MISKPPATRPPLRNPTDAELLVTAADLERLDAIHRILARLNDPRASAANLARDAAELPVLCARVTRHFFHWYPKRGIPSLTEQIALLGNRVLEQILLELLEDIVTLHCTRDDPPQ